MKKLILMAAALLFAAGAADAKWWIFGKSKDEVGFKYLYINKVSADEAGPKMKIYSETLGTDGLVKVNGRAYTGRNAVGSVRISLDDKATWQDVKFADNGTFEYSFKPEAGKAYAMLLEVTDTAGRTNKVEETRKEISLSGESVQAKVKEALDALFAAYSAENLAKFMAGVGENFAGDKAILERAVKRDFDALNSINLRYTLNNVSAGAQGRVFASVTYSRMVIVNKTGQASSDTGSTEFVFDSNEGRLSLYSMKQPLMFGLSDADNVATGSVLGNTGTALTLNDAGTLGGAVTNSYYTADGSFGYSVEDNTFEECDGSPSGCSGQMVFMTMIPYVGADDNPFAALIGIVPGKDINSVTLSDAQAAATQPNVMLAQGNTYGLKYNGAYYAVQVTLLSGTVPANITLKAKAF